MKMSKTSKILATASALMLAITAAGCGSSEKSSSEKEDTTASKEVEPAGSVENANAEGTDKSDVDIANEFKEQLNEGMTEPASITTEASSEKSGVGQQVADLDEESKRLIEESAKLREQMEKNLEGYSGNTGSTETTTSASGASTATKTGFTRVGEAKYGYIDVPTDWHKFVDLDADSSKLFQYSDALGQSIVTMSYYDIDGFDAKQAADNFYNNLYKDSGVDTDSITGAKVKLGNKYDAYQVYCYYSDINSFLVAHFFDGEDGYVHYVTFEGKEWETFELADTYSLTE